MKLFTVILFLISFMAPGLQPMAIGAVKKVEISGEKKLDPKIVNIMADKLVQEKKTNQIVGTGKVKVKYKGMRIAADRIELNTNSGFGTARGKVVFIDEMNDHKIESSLMKFNIKTKRVIIYNSKGIVAKEFFFHGKKIERKSDTHYVINDGDITSCIGDNPVWKFKCSRLEAHMGKYATLNDPTFLIKGKPVFYFPYGYIPLDMERSTGFIMPLFGNSDEDGAFINNAFFWAINDQWDATFGLDYLSKRGIRPNAELRYYTSETTKGRWYADFLKERDTGDLYWKILVDHKQKLPYEIDAAMNVEWLEGTDYDKIYSESIMQRTRRETDNYLTFSKNWQNRSLFFETRYHKSLDSALSNESGVLPQIIFKNQLQKIKKTPLYFEMETSYANFANKMDAYSPVQLTQRFDFNPQISMPINKWKWLTITPKFGFRETVYDHGKIDNINNNNTMLHRTLFNADANITGPSFTKTFSSKEKGGNSYKHLIEPRINYNYVHDPGSVAQKIVVTDGIDSILKTNLVNFSLTNRVLKKIPVGESFTTQEILRFDISQSYDFNFKDIPGAKAFSDLRLDFDSHVTEKIMFNLDTTYDIYDKLFKTLNVEMVMKPWKDFGFYVERRYNYQISTDILGSVRWQFLKNWELDLSTRYDEKNKQFRQNDASIFYQAQCWGFGLEATSRINYIGGSQVDDTRFMFHISLKGIGSFGSGKDKSLHKRF